MSLWLFVDEKSLVDVENSISLALELGLEYKCWQGLELCYRQVCSDPTNYR